MKILMLTTAMDIGGAETHIAELCRGLTRMGYTVGVASAGGRYAEELSEEGIATYTLPLNKKDPLSVMRCRRELVRIIKEEGYTNVHAHARIPAVVAGSVRGKCPFRFTTTVHLDFAVNGLWRRITPWGDRAVAVSEDLREYLSREYGVSPDRVTVTVNGIDMDRFSPSKEKRDSVREEFSIPDGDRLLVYISRLDEDRSAPAKLLCGAMDSITECCPNTSLLIVGNGNDYDAVASAAEEANGRLGREAVRLAGTRYDIDRFCAAADVFVGVSRSALEAMSVECPVILSGNQGHMGIFTSDMLDSAVETNFCCRGCELPTEEALARDVKDLLQRSEAETSEMGRFNRETVRERYSLDKMCKDYAEIFEKEEKQPLFIKAEAVVSGYFGYGNMGDELALSCLADAIRDRVPEVKITALSHDPKKFGKAYGVDALGRYSLLRMIKRIKKADLLISGGGSLFQNVTSGRSLCYYAAVIGAAHLVKTPVFIYANGIGPLRGRRALRTVRRACDRAALISVRDRASRDTLEAIGVPSEKIRVSADPVFLMRSDSLPDISALKRELGIRDGVGYMALSLRGGMYDSGAREELCRGIREVYLTRGMIPLFVSMQASEDRELIRIAARESCGEAVVLPPVSAETLLAVLRGCRVTVSMRLHLILLSAVAGRGAVAVGDDPKLTSAAAELSFPVTAVRHLTAQRFVQAVDMALLCEEESVLETVRRAGESASADALLAAELLCGAAAKNGFDEADGADERRSNIIREN